MGKVMDRIVNKHHDNNINFMLLQLGTMLSALVFIFATSYLYLIAVQVILGVSWSLLYLGSLINLSTTIDLRHQ